MTYAKEFFGLQLQFAQTVSNLSGLPLTQAVLEYTNFYVRFGLGRDFDPARPGWQEYVTGLRDASDRQEWTYRFYLTRPPAMDAPAVVASFGCFSYARVSDDRIRLHFRNTETDGHSPIGAARRGHRLADLAALFQHVKHTAPVPPRVLGASWLYNLEAYRRLFPGPYLATARVLPHRFQHMPLWGQFVNRHGEIREDTTRQFLERLGRQTCVEGLDQCFPFQILALEASADAFYDFYARPWATRIS